MDKYFLNKWTSISWIRFHPFSSKTIWSLISNAKTQACVPLDIKIKLVWILFHYQPQPNLTTESYTDRQAHAVLEVPVPAITTNCLGWKIFLAKYKNMEFLNWHDDLKLLLQVYQEEIFWKWMVKSVNNVQKE